MIKASTKERNFGPSPSFTPGLMAFKLRFSLWYDPLLTSTLPEEVFFVNHLPACRAWQWSIFSCWISWLHFCVLRNLQIKHDRLKKDRVRPNKTPVLQANYLLTCCMDFRLISEFQTFGFGFWLFDRIFLVPRLDIWNCSSANQALTSNCWILHWSWYPYKIPLSKVYQGCNLDNWKRNNFACVSLKSLCYVYSEYEWPLWK